MGCFSKSVPFHRACLNLGEQLGDRPGAVRETIHFQAQVTGDAQPCVTDRGAIGTLQVPPALHLGVRFAGQHQRQIKVLMSGSIPQAHTAGNDGIV